MQKIPTLFERDWEGDRSRVLEQVHAGCEWVLAGEGMTLRKYDGTCVMFDGEKWFARRELRAGQPAPPGFKGHTHDKETDKTIGWQPIEDSPFAKFHAEAAARKDEWDEGTYELIGPKVNKNPEGAAVHTLINHERAEGLGLLERSYEGIKEFLIPLDVEGIVFRHTDGRMAKIKKRDFGLPR